MTGKPTITVGSVSLDGADFVYFFATGEDNKMGDLMERLENEEFDLIAVGRALLANHDWVKNPRWTNRRINSVYA